MQPVVGDFDGNLYQLRDGISQTVIASKYIRLRLELKNIPKNIFGQKLTIYPAVMRWCHEQQF